MEREIKTIVVFNNEYRLTHCGGSSTTQIEKLVKRNSRIEKWKTIYHGHHSVLKDFYEAFK